MQERAGTICKVRLGTVHAISLPYMIVHAGKNTTPLDERAMHN